MVAWLKTHSVDLLWNEQDQVEMDYYKDRENIGRPIIKTNAPGSVMLKPENLSVRTNTPISLWEPAGKLMEMTEK